uniref:Uncharacterized protein n=1 Tax=Romanomermis culicivorax TaxID=13658 RepID=A0A915I9Z6_ROMCU
QIIFADIIQVFFSGIVTGLFVLSPDLSSVWWLNTACGALASGAWFLYSFSANLLAFNRFVHIVYNDKVDQIFSPKLTARYLVVLYIYSFLWILVLISPPIGIKFSPNHNTYVCNKLDKYCFWMSRAALVFDWINVTCICVFYTILCVKVRFK